MEDRIEMPDYKNQQIWYDIFLDKFVCSIEINGEVRDAKKRSLKELRKDIDAFVKLNQDFKPFRILWNEYVGEGIGYEYVVEGIREDKKFVVRKKGAYRPDIVTKIALESANLYDEDVVYELELLANTLETMRKQHKLREVDLKKTLKPIDLSMYEI